MGRHVRMAYDEKRRVITLVCQDIPEPQTSQTWLWYGELWVQVADTGPSKTDSLVWDAKREMLVATTEDSLWEWSGTNWTQVSDRVTGMGTSAFRHSRGRLIRTTFKENSPALTWEWNDGAWTQIDDMGPPKRAKFDLLYDVERAVTLLVAGAIYSRDTPTGFFSGSPAKDTWAFDGRWKAVADFGPSPRWEQASAYDSDRNCVVLFGRPTLLLRRRDEHGDAAGGVLRRGIARVRDQAEGHQKTERRANQGHAHKRCSQHRRAVHSQRGRGDS